MPTWLWWVVWIGAVYAVLVVPVLVILKMRKAKSDITTTFKRKASEEPADTLIVHFPGFGGDGLHQIANNLPDLREKADVLAVHYDGLFGTKANAFSVDLLMNRLFREIYDAVKYYDRIVLIGTSMGAKMCYMLAQYLAPYHIKTNGILVDPPLLWRDLQNVQRFFSLLLVALPYVPVANLTLIIRPIEKQVIKGTFPGPKEDEIDDDLTLGERAALDYSVTRAQEIRLTFCRDQVIAMLRRPPKDLRRLTSPWTKKDVVLIRSMGDSDVVRESAAESWAGLLGFHGIKQLKIRGAKHAAYGQNPKAYRRKAFPAAFTFLGIE